VMRDSLETYATTGDFTNAWNGWYALGHYALWSAIDYEPARDRSLALSDTMISEDGDGDGGIPARPADTDSMDQTWVTSYLAFMGLDPWIAAGTDVPPYADGERFEPLIVRAAPNPFRGETTIMMSQTRLGIPSIRIFDLSGRLVRDYDDLMWTAGSLDPLVQWDGRDNQGHDVPAGIYVLRVKTPTGTGTAKITRVH